MTKIVIYGSACNPPHLGHHSIIRDLKSLNFDDVWYMPCYQHMFDKTMIDFDHRFKMAQIVSGVEEISVCDIEKNFSKKIGTYGLLKILEQQNPGIEFSFAIGADNLINFKKWLYWQTLAQQYEIIVYQRPGYNVAEDEHILKEFARLVIRDLPGIDVSSTEIRNHIFINNPVVEDYIHPKVLEYIREKKLYHGRLPDDIKKQVNEDPYYFIMQGGSDGTFGHDNYLCEFKEWEPEISDYARLVCEREGIKW